MEYVIVSIMIILFYRGFILPARRSKKAIAEYNFYDSVWGQLPDEDRKYAYRVSMNDVSILRKMIQSFQVLTKSRISDEVQVGILILRSSVCAIKVAWENDLRDVPTFTRSISNVPLSDEEIYNACAWGIDTSNLLVVRQSFRNEVGYGLEDYYPDSKSPESCRARE